MLRGLAMRAYYGVTVAAEVVSAALAVLLLLQGYGLLSLVAQVYLRLLAMLLLYSVLMTERPWRMASFELTGPVLRWSSMRYSSVLLNFASNYGADFMLGIFLSPVATGIYRAGNRIVLAISDLFAQPLQKIIMTRLSARAARRLPLGMEWLVMFTGGAAIGWAVLAGLAVAADDVVPLLLGEKWAPAAPVVAILCAVRALSLLDVATTSLLVCLNRQRYLLAIQAGASISIVAASSVLAPFGPRAVAIGSGCVLLCLTIAFLRRAVALSGGTARDLLGALGTALAPAVCVIATIELFRWIAPASPDVPWAPVIRAGVGGALGATLGIAIVRRRFMDALGRLGATGGDRPPVML